MINVLDLGMDVADTVSAACFQHQWQPDRLLLELVDRPNNRALLKENNIY
tara:strand:- start:4073 stop:4222 length:150 start_codon:yes stop_codon:yes gene_type:complete